MTVLVMIRGKKTCDSSYHKPEVRDVEPLTKAGAAEAVAAKVEQGFLFSVGVSPGSDGSGRLIKGVSRRQPAMTSLRGFGRLASRSAF